MADKDVKVEKKEEVIAPKVKAKLLVVGFGGCGTTAIAAMLRKYDPEMNPHLTVLAMESNQSQLKNRFEVNQSEEADCGHMLGWTRLEDRFLKLQLGEKGWGAGGDANKGEEMVKEEEKTKLLKDLFAKYDSVCLVAGLGGGTCGAVPPVAEMLQKMNIPTYAILAMPSVGEGPERVRHGGDMYERILKYCTVTLIENERWQDKTIDDEEAWQKINETSLFWILDFYKSLLQDWGDVRDLDLSDLKKLLATGNHALPISFDATNNSLGDIDNVLFSGAPCLNPRIIENALRVVLWYESDKGWPIQDREAIQECIRKKMVHGEPYELKFGIKKRGVEKGVKRVRLMAVAKDPPRNLPDANEKKEGSVFAMGKPMTPETGVPAIVGRPMVSLEVAPPAPQKTNGAVVAEQPKVRFEVVINAKGDKQEVEASPELAKRYQELSLYTGNPSLFRLEIAEKVQRAIAQATEVEIYIPHDLTRLRPKS
ncbi:hypothetical protein HY311_00555 [Candidatus Nomurabacteria bacterium]|nr:hypothetical protein [Candidatus Nomurabacteria bacterium]